MWIALTTSSLQTAMSSAEYAKFSTALTGSLTSEYIIQECIDEITAEVRSYCVASYKNDLESDETLIPMSTVNSALALLVVRVNQRLGGKLVDVSGQREKAYDAAIERLLLISQGKIGVEKPSNPVPVFTEKDTAVASTDNQPLIW